MPVLTLTLLPSDHTVARLPADAAVPSWLPTSGFTSVTRTSDELSVVAPTEAVPTDAVPSDAAPSEDGSWRREPGWRLFRLEGPFEFTLTGILAAVLDPLAAAGVGIFAVSTFDTDYVMVKQHQLDAAVAALAAAGHEVRGVPV